MLEERKLATIRRVKEIRPIEGADKIELAIIDGWQCVVKKGEFIIGDLSVYFEIDSMLPIEERYEFLRKSSYKKIDGGEGFRLKSVRLKGMLSQGLLLPLTLFPEILKKAGVVCIEIPTSEGKEPNTLFTVNVPYNPDAKVEVIGMSTVGSIINDACDKLEKEDVTDLLRITKYEKPIPAQLRGKIKGNFPHFLKKTDQERIQNMPEVVEQHWFSEFEVTIKLDGTSMTVFYLNSTSAAEKAKKVEQGKDYFGICSRNLELSDDEGNAYYKMAHKAGLLAILREYGKNIALQGELMGEGVQGNKEKLVGVHFFIFDVWSIDECQYLAPAQRKTVIMHLNEIANRLSLPELETVPHILTGSLENILTPVITLHNTQSLIDAVLKFAEGKSLNAAIREGVVFRSCELIHGNIVSFKAINNEFLLKYDDRE